MKKAKGKAGANSTRKQPAVTNGVISSRDASLDRVATEFIKAIAQHRHWEREPSS